MYKLSEIKELIKLVDSTSIQHLEIENEHGKLSIRKPDSAAPVAAQQPSAAANLPQYITAPISSQSAAVPTVHAATSTGSDANAEMVSAGLHKIVSPMVGTFYAAPSPDAAPFVTVGDMVKEKSVVCIVEAMKLMNEIEAEASGQIVEVLVENGQLVEYGQPLFLLKR
jgi:acetyl-CoA carboxylase biotin carboxyl carrier protein